MGVRMWFIAPLEMSARARVCLACAPRFVSDSVLDFALRANALHKIQPIHICVRVCVWMQEAMGCASLSVTALLFLFSNWRRQRTRHTAVMAG